MAAQIRAAARKGLFKMTESIKIRNPESIKLIEKLTKKLEMATKTGLVAFVVSRHLDLVATVKNQEQKIYELERELRDIKSILRDKTKADKNFSELCDSLGEDPEKKSNLKEF